jgi:modulator of FtsH protease
MNRYDMSAQPAEISALSTNKLIKNTYMLLSATLLFSAVMAAVSVFLEMPPWTYLASIIVAMILGIFVLPRTSQSAAGLGMIFLITGLMGFGLGAVISQYLALPKGPQIIATAFGGTGAIFLALSGYALTTKRDFSFMGGFLFAGMIVVLLAVLANFFMQLPLLSLVISAVVILLMSGYILYDTSQMVHGGETNYIHATFELYLDIFLIFVHLLRILGVMGDD